MKLLRAMSKIAPAARPLKGEGGKPEPEKVPGISSWALRSRFYRQASSQLENGKTLTSVLDDFRARLQQRGRIRAANAVEQILRRVRNGDTLQAAMGDDLSDLERSLLAAGEKSGALANSMQLVLEVRGMTGRMTNQLRAAMFAPTVYVLTLYAVLWVIGASIVPQLAGAAPVSKWTGWAYVMYLMGEFATGWAMPVTFGVFSVAAAWSFFAMPRWNGRGRIFLDRHIFPFTAYREVTGFAWLLSFAALLRSGVPDTEALAGQTRVGSPWLVARLKPIELSLKNGLDLATAMRRTGMDFPSLDLIDEVRAYVGYTDFPEKLEGVARQYAKELEISLARTANVLSFTITGLMFLCFIILQLGSNEISAILSSTLGR